MGLRTAEAYLEGLNDGREVYFRGKRIPNVLEDHDILTAAEHGANDYALQFDEEHRKLAVVFDEELGEEVSRYYCPPRSSDDLVKRRALIESASRHADSLIPFLKDIGSDAMFTMLVVTAKVDAKYGTNYHERVEAFRKRVAREDLSLAGSVTDVKGNRSLRPSQQADPDLYVRIVERRKDGIVINGAKIHNSAAVNSDWLVAVPTRAMTADDADYAVAFAVPANAPGVKMLVRTERAQEPFEYPVSGKHFILESLTVFDNVFVPWENVFMAGEWEFAGDMANTFGCWHRFTAMSYKTPQLELMMGCGLLLAEANGIEKGSHIRRNLIDMAIYLETMRALGDAACSLKPQIDELTGLAIPNVTYTNLAKYYFASNYHMFVRQLQEIAGGLLVTAPAVTDLRNDVTRPLIDKYLAGGNGWSGIDRMRLMKLAKDYTASEYAGLALVSTIHAEGSLEAQRMSILREMDTESCKAYARKVGRIGQPVE